MTFVICKNFPKYKDKYFESLCGGKAVFVRIGEDIGERSDDFISSEICIDLTYANILSFITRYRKEKFILGSWDTFKPIILGLLLNNVALIIEGKTELRRGIKSLLKRVIIKRCQLVLTTSCETYQDLCDLFPGLRVEYIPSVGFPLDFRPLEKGKVIKFVFIGRIVKDKNVEKAIEFVLNFKRRFRDTEVLLHIYGDGALIKDLIDKFSNEEIVFKGKIESASLPKVLGAYDALLLLSSYEPWGLVVDEALKAGVLPVVSSSVGAKDLRNLHPMFEQIEIVKELKNYNYRRLYKKIQKFKTETNLGFKLSSAYIQHEQKMQKRLLHIGKTRLR